MVRLLPFGDVGSERGSDPLLEVDLDSFASKAGTTVEEEVAGKYDPDRESGLETDWLVTGEVKGVKLSSTSS